MPLTNCRAWNLMPTAQPGVEGISVPSLETHLSQARIGGSSSGLARPCPRSSPRLLPHHDSASAGTVYKDVQGSANRRGMVRRHGAAGVRQGAPAPMRAPHSTARATEPAAMMNLSGLLWNELLEEREHFRRGRASGPFEGQREACFPSWISTSLPRSLEQLPSAPEATPDPGARGRPLARSPRPPRHCSHAGAPAWPVPACGSGRAIPDPPSQSSPG